MPNLIPFYAEVQAHYDLCDEFFQLFLDKSRTYSCAYFEREDMTLEEAQLAKIDLSLRKCDLRPGMKLLDIGCGWGTTARRAAEAYGVDVVGLTLSKNQVQHARQVLAESQLAREHVEYRLQGWEEFDEPVDRIVSIGAFEHFRHVRHADFFEACRRILPEDGRMLLHTIVLSSAATIQQLGLTIVAEDVEFAKFIRREIFPGGQLCVPERIVSLAAQAGFDTQDIQSLRLHYAQTLDHWAERLQAQRLRAIELTSETVFERYMKYLTGCADKFRSGHIDVMQFRMHCVAR